MAYMQDESNRVLSTPTDRASFLAYDLNLPQSPTREVIFTVGDLMGCYVDILPERSGPAYLGLGLWGSQRCNGGIRNMA